jgi:tape measure domain-containing protein
MPSGDSVVTTYVLDAGAYVRGAQQVQAATAATGRSISGFKSLGRSMSSKDGGDIAAGFLNLVPIVGKVLALVERLAIAGAGAIASIAGLGYIAMKTAGDFEAMERGMTAIVGSAEEAKRQLKELQEVAKLPGLGYKEAVEGAIGLQAVGMDFRLAERSLLGFGNAIALVGGGKEELGGVIRQLEQLAGRARLTSEDISVMAENLPLIRRVIEQIYGTGDIEAISAMGVGPQEFISAVVDYLTTQLPTAMGGAKNSFENFGDVVQRVLKDIGDTLNKFLMPMFDRFVGYIEKLTKGGEFAKIAGKFLGVLGIDVEKAPSSSMGGKAASDPIARFVATAVATLETIPDFIKVAIDFLKAGIQNEIKLIEALTGFVRQMAENLSRIPFLGRGMADVAKALVLGKGQADPADRIPGILNQRDKRIGELLTELDQPDQPTTMSKGQGSWKSLQAALLEKIEQHTAQTAKNTLDHSRHIVGGGDLARIGVTSVEMGRTYSHDRIGKALSDLDKAIRIAMNETLGGQLVDYRRSGLV